MTSLFNPCPLCGSAVNYYSFCEWGEIFVSDVECVACHLTLRAWSEESEESSDVKLIRRWNRRRPAVE